MFSVRTLSQKTTLNGVSSILFRRKTNRTTNKRGSMKRASAVIGCCATLGLGSFLSGCDGSSSNKTTKITSALVVPASAYPTRTAVYQSGDRYTFLATTEETNGAFNLFDFTVPADRGPIPHIHGTMDETFYVISGAGLNIKPNGIPLSAPIGSFMYGARLRPHGFSNAASAAEGHILSLSTYAMLDKLFKFAGDPVTNYNAPIPPIYDAQFGRIIQWTNQNDPGGGPFLDPAQILPDVTAGGPTDSVLVLPTSTIPPEAQNVPGLKTYTYDQRPHAVGDLGITYTNMVDFSETNNTLAYYEFSTRLASTFPPAITSTDSHMLFVLSGNLTLTVDGQTTVLAPLTSVVIKPGQSYTFADFTPQPVHAVYAAIRGSDPTFIGKSARK